MKLSEMRELLARENIQLTKSMGQNFLHDAHQLQRIVDAAELTRRDKVLEIGPGLGPLTELLLEKAGEVLAIELDARLVDFLQKSFGLESQAAPDGESLTQSATETVESEGGVLGLLHEDALGFLKREQRDWRDWKLVANLPYSVASPILVELSQGERSPERLVATLQLEVAKRLMAKADDEDYGILTLLVQIDFEPRGWFKIPSSCFFPEPGVDSACVCLIRRPQLLLNVEQRKVFIRLVKLAFSQRRKMMLKLLKQQWPLEKLTAVFATLNISPQERAEKLSLEQFVELTKLLA
ncbi:MAG TPA: 16S rRNA (adenine(1518)-N(6)/adenine(1519)-N(6))-dimethyltransferase RsmA [Verrucomicrobiae bacterium]|nr:16S rRNA (adenine(1518)-N(6)/adenine(1519)-N(6))-dimethyltransferase RsmA [Verrucomicrobiae bacterium]